MTNKFGLYWLWEDLSNYLEVNVEVSQNESPSAKLPAIIQFVVTNIGKAQEDQPEIIFEEVQLKVGVPPDWWVERAEHLAGGQSFTYEHHCTYDAIMRMQWTIEGRVSPTALLQFRRKPSSINRNRQLPVKAYFDFLEQINIHQWLDGILKSLVTPDPDTTLAEMKAKEDSLSDTIGEIRNSVKQLQDFLGLVDYEKYREDILRHNKLVQEYLKQTEREIGELITLLKTHKTEGFNRSRDNIIAKLTGRASGLGEATEALTKTLGFSKTNADIEVTNEALPRVEPPQPIALREIDLHGNNVDEAIPIVEEFLKESYRDNVRRVRIIHGKGIFVLRDAIREYLGKHKFVKPESISPADKDHGGEGATEANLVDFSVNE